MLETTGTGRDFALLAEERRRAGDAHAALGLAEQGIGEARAASADELRTRVALALALLDLGDLPRARTELARGLDALFADAAAPHTEPRESVALDPSNAFGRTLEEQEIDDAFEQAETNPDEMMDANKVVERTLRVEEAHAGVGFDLSEHPTYATNTMAELLASQGSTAQAEALRQSLSQSQSATRTDLDAARAPAVSEEPIGMGLDHAECLRVVATLESWLHNVRRNAQRDAAHAAGAANTLRGA